MSSYTEAQGRKRYNRAVGIAEFIIEGNTKQETVEEFRVSRDTIDRDLEFLRTCLWGDKEGNLKLYTKAKKQFQKNSRAKKEQ